MAIMEAQTSPSPPFSTEGLGPCELSYSHSFNAYNEHNWVFWSTCGNDEGGCGKPHHLSATADGAVIKDQIKWVLQLVMEAISWWRCLVQFWGLVKIGDKTCLTTRDQPFALQYYHCNVTSLLKPCEYRKHCLAYLIPVDGEIIIGPLGRVFRSGLPERVWNVRDYTIREYPQRDYAVSRVEEYWVLPIYHHPTQHLPIGILEIVSPCTLTRLPRRRVLEKLECPPPEVNLTTTCVSPPAEVNSCQDGEIAIIDEALSKVRQIRGLSYDATETWTISGEILSHHRGVDFIRKGQGVVGRAFSSKSACFCRDVGQLSITEYPLVPNARHNGDSACFAVCLQSSCPNNCIYVLEFFLPTNEEDEDEDEADTRDPRTLLNSIMETLKEHLGSSFKIASGQELGQKLTVEVIKVSPEDEYSFEICSTTGTESQPRLEEAQGGDGMMQLDFSSQQVDTANAYINVQQTGIFGSPPRPEHEQGLVNISYQELNLAAVDVAHNSTNGIYEQQNGIVRSPSTTGQELVQNMVSIEHDEPIVEDPQRDGASIEQRDNEVTNLKVPKPSCTLKSDLGITREVLEQNSTRKLEDAAKHIGVSRSTLKRICREYGIKRWPPRKARKVSQAFAVQKTVQPSTEDTHEHHRSDATRVEDDNGMWVKAEYQGRMIKFRLPFSARKIDLEENVVQRLNVAMGSFIIEYQDEDDDRIWITCDGDLRTSMSTLSSLGRTTIKMYIVEDSPSKRDQ
ncbi:protein NLP3-like [Coffea eugenioides]|uniref:protein NLP3-like n=1 Tax=Coffea eugenioides TaxID=49369 RepID=UPI000F615745|nr:protein NLP3-like [Coffea eugenioides]